MLSWLDKEKGRSKINSRLSGSLLDDTLKKLTKCLRKRDGQIDSAKVRV